MIVLEGLPALSPFRRERLETRLQALSSGVRVTGAWHAYWIDTETGAEPDRVALRRILQADEASHPLDAGAQSRFVLPRLGTISPWASKATELLRGAGLPIKRVERGLRIDVAGWPAPDDSAQSAAMQDDLSRALSKLLHDPMTQSLLADRDAACALFAPPARGAL
ncbi:MAG: phosphoribosylformylglycinamidine synthase, partial [Luteimonas sp.]